MQEVLEISGFTGSGRIILDYTDAVGNNPVSYIVRSCTLPVLFDGGDDAPTLDSVGRSAIIDIMNCIYVDASKLNLNGDGSTNYGLRVRDGSVVVATNVIPNNVKYAMMAQSSRLSVRHCGGLGSQYGLWASRGGIISGEGDAPAGGVSNIMAHQGGFTEGTWSFPSAPEPPEAPQPTRKTVTFNANNASHYYTNGIGWNSTFMSDYPIQGKWNSLGMRYGLWYFGSDMRNTLNGKNIVQARITIGRTSRNAQGMTGARKFTLRMHRHATQPSGAPEYSSTNYTDYLSLGEKKTFDVTDTFSGAMSNGTWYGFGVFTQSTSNYEYMAMMQSLKVEVTYEV